MAGKGLKQKHPIDHCRFDFPNSYLFYQIFKLKRNKKISIKKHHISICFKSKNKLIKLDLLVYLNLVLKTRK